MQTLDNTHEEQVTVEAETVEDALAEISTQLGADAEIVRAQKVHRGGVGGFFAREMVQLTARPRRPSAPRQRPRPQSRGIAGVLERLSQDADAEDGDFRSALRRELVTEPVESGPGGFLPAADWAPDVAAPSIEIELPAPDEPDLEREEPTAPVFVDQAPGDNTPDPVAVGPVLHVPPVFSELDAEPTLVEVEPGRAVAATVTYQTAPVPSPVATSGVPAEPHLAAEDPLNNETSEGGKTVPDPDSWRTAGTADAPAGMGSVDWCTTALLRLGLPAPLISAVADLDPNDDLGWIDGIASIVAPHCGPLPQGDVIVVGPHAERLAEPLGLPLIRSGDMAPYAGSFCAMVEDSTQDRTWLEFVQGHRGIHLVIGEEPWQDLLVGDPVAVSWVGETAVSNALNLAFTLGAKLGYGTVDGFVSSMVRAQPTDIALAVRRIVGRR